MQLSKCCMLYDPVSKKSCCIIQLLNLLTIYPLNFEYNSSHKRKRESLPNRFKQPPSWALFFWLPKASETEVLRRIRVKPAVQEGQTMEPNERHLDTLKLPRAGDGRLGNCQCEVALFLGWRQILQVCSHQASEFGF